MRRRVVVTGIGAVTPLGIGVEPTWNNLVAGESGIQPITYFDTTGFTNPVAGQIYEFEPRDFMDKKEVRRTARFSQLAIAAARLAIEHASLDIDSCSTERCGVLLGNGFGGFPGVEAGVKRMQEKGVTRLSPLFFPMELPNMAAANVGRMFGFQGYNSTVTTACAASTQAIGEAAEAIARDTTDLMLAGGTEAGISALGLGGFVAARAVSTSARPPAERSRPFDGERDGFVGCEGSGILVLESLEHATKRGAPLLAEVLGFGSSCDAFHLVQPPPQGDGALLAMGNALRSANIDPSEIDYINAHGTSTILNDSIETIAIKRLFGERAKSVPISSTKSMIGHGLGAAGAMEAVVCVQTLLAQRIHPTINQTTPDPACDLDYVPNESRAATVDTILTNSFGFGGQNACLVLRRV